MGLPADNNAKTASTAVFVLLSSRGQEQKKKTERKTEKTTRNTHYDVLRVCFFANVKRPKNIKHFFGEDNNRQNTKNIV